MFTLVGILGPCNPIYQSSDTYYLNCDGNCSCAGRMSCSPYTVTVVTDIACNTGSYTYTTYHQASTGSCTAPTPSCSCDVNTTYSSFRTSCRVTVTYSNCVVTCSGTCPSNYSYTYTGSCPAI